MERLRNEETKMQLKRAGIPALCSFAPRIMVTAWLVTGGWSIAGAAEPADYLQVINEEAHKVEQRQPFIRDDTDNPNAATTLARVSPDATV